MLHQGRVDPLLHEVIVSLGLLQYQIIRIMIWKLASQVGLKTSRILLIIDINSMIPIYLTESNWPAVAHGQNGELLKIKVTLCNL